MHDEHGDSRTRASRRAAGAPAAMPAAAPAGGADQRLLNTPAAAMVDLLPDAVVLYDATGRIVRTNATARRLFALDRIPGYGSLPYTERVRMIASRALDGQSLSEDEWHITRLLRGEAVHGAQPVVARVRSLDGAERILSVTGAPIRDEQGAILGAIAIAIPIGREVAGEVTDLERHDRERKGFAEQAAQLAATIDALSDGLVLFDAHGHLKRMNVAARTLLGLDASPADYTLAAQSSSRYDVRDERGALLESAQWPIARIMAGETLAGADAQDLVIRALDGTARQVSISGAPVRDKDGVVTGAVCIIHDVTEHRRLERRTREALDALLAMARAVVSLGTDARDGALTQAEGGTAEGAEGESGEIAKDTTHARRTRSERREKGEGATAEDAVERRERSAAGVAGVAGVASADDAPRQLARLACEIVGCARTAIVGLDEQEQLVPVAIAGEGISSEEAAQWSALLGGVPLARFLDAGIVAGLREGRGAVIDTTHSPRREASFGASVALIVPMRVGERLIGVLSLDSGRPAQDYGEDDIALAAAVAQLTALVMERERLLRGSAEAGAALLALSRTNRLMNEFLGIAGHELRTPLTAIRANAQLATHILRRASTALTELSAAAELPSALSDLTALLTRIEQQSRRQERLVNDLLDVSRIETGEMELRPARVDLAEVVREAVAEQRLLHPKRTIRLSPPRAARPAWVSADADRISQVITNYLSNALKYSAERRPVTVAVRMRGGSARVEVRDRGPGLPPVEQSRVWERFHRAPGVEVRSGSGIGMGLGLYISKTIVERHGGSVGVESAPGAGCTFWFALPLLRA